ncbi:MAG: hypothetical protein KKF46_02755 [Nanoarchaeota archaeon]|nr:hypothetical protein [Nanoarchaeota archaeon]MBU1321252.1 hypothetical protein [Nanoarchaeota archaeon]MBU1597974.1 hypothetical protein [Nanoarchaeota archaeon]MBU2440994.1 hypothetical protein [Nanoarchaeota archaeon]
MNKNIRKTEEILIIISVLLILTLTFIVFEKTLPDSFQKITGRAMTTVNVTLPPPENCTFTLQSGWNLVSFFCISNMAELNDVVGNITELEAIFEYQEESSDLWKSYNPSLPSFVIQDLEMMTRTEGYWIRMDASENYNFEGGLRLPTSISLVSGWNLAGYPTNENKTATTAFTTIQGNFEEVRTYNASTDVYVSYVPGVGGALATIQPYYGYWINANASDVWVVD